MVWRRPSKEELREQTDLQWGHNPGKLTSTILLSPLSTIVTTVKATIVVFDLVLLIKCPPPCNKYLVTGRAV